MSTHTDDLRDETIRHVPGRGIDGTITTYGVVGEPKARMHVGRLRVRDGSIRAADVLIPRMPDPPPKTDRTVVGITVSGDGTYAELTVVDRPIT